MIIFLESILVFIFKSCHYQQDSPPDDLVISAPDSAGAPTVEAAAARANRVPPSEDNIELLISMGFDRESVVSALTSANNNADRATDLLLNAVN